jgi:hypothetical protein
MLMKQRVADPQQWNAYAYTRDNPLRFLDENGKWPTEIHEKIIDKAFPGLSAHQREVLKSSSSQMDHCTTCQLEGSSYQHYMRAPNQSPAEAKQQAQDFITTDEQLAKSVQKGTPAKASDINDKSLSLFGNAGHTVMDSTSPAHVDPQGNPLPWNPYSPSAVKAHEAAESTISDDQMAKAVGALQQAFQDTYGPAAAQQASTPPPPPVPPTQPAPQQQPH